MVMVGPPMYLSLKVVEDGCSSHTLHMLMQYMVEAEVREPRTRGWSRKRVAVHGDGAGCVITKTAKCLNAMSGADGGQNVV
jgi:hypothetical protein